MSAVKIFKFDAIDADGMAHVTVEIAAGERRNKVCVYTVRRGEPWSSLEARYNVSLRLRPAEIARREASKWDDATEPVEVGTW